MPLKQQNRAGFTLVEAMASITIMVMALGLAMSGYVYTMRSSADREMQDILDNKMRLALERLKKDLRLSSQDQIFCYPEGSGPYTAISFPIAIDDDGDGLFEKDENGYIEWDQTAIYHIAKADEGTPKLVKTTFSPRDTSLTAIERIAQLKAVVQSGNGSSTHNGENASSKTLFENLMKWAITIESAKFDAYYPTEERQYIDLGYHLLETGTHDFKFTAIGKNDSSGGYQLGIDQLRASLSCSDREAEAQLFYGSGATPVKELMQGNGGDYEGGYRLWFPASGAEASLTFELDNDRWEETNFTDDNRSYVLENTVSVWDTNHLDNVIKLEGNADTWSTSLQTFSSPTNTTIDLAGAAVRVLVKGAELGDNGGWISVNGRQCRLTFNAAESRSLEIEDVNIGESFTNNSARLTFASDTITKVTFNNSTEGTTSGGVLVSDWVDLEIDQEKNYIVSFRIANDSGKCWPAEWINRRGDFSATSLIATNGVSAYPCDESWDHLAGSIISNQSIIGLSSIFASYADSGSYESPVFDTALNEPQFKDISWNSTVPNSCSLAFKIRSSDNEDMSGAMDWENIDSFTSPRSVSASYKRFIQFQTLFTSDAQGAHTPILNDVTVDWPGEKRIVNISAQVTVGPNCGIYELTVDGQQLISTLSVDLMVYDDLFIGDGKTKRMESRMQLDIHPRNTGF